MRPIEQLASHECGHLTACLVYGIEIGLTEITGHRRPEYAGRVACRVDTHPDRIEVAVMTLCGPVAEKMYHGYAGHWVNGRGSDWDEYRKEVRRIYPGNDVWAERDCDMFFHWAAREAESLLCIYAGRFYALRRALVKKRSLTADEARKIWRDSR